MSYHSSFEWKFEDGLVEGLVEELVTGLESNRSYNKGSCNEDKYMSCYGCFCHMDQLMYNIGIALDAGKDLSDPEIADAHLTKAPEEYKEGLKAILLGVGTAMKKETE